LVFFGVEGLVEIWKSRRDHIEVAHGRSAKA
jgi:hypothetical protein